MSVVALIPLRAGGTRVGKINGLDKERAVLGKHPLMAYTIRWAIESGVFDNVIAVVASDDHAAMAEEYGAQVPMRRPPHTTEPDSPDIDWVFWIMRKYWGEYRRYSTWAILRVTSPFRTSKNINDAYKQFTNTPGIHSLRCVTPVEDHPGKMWVIRQNRLLPLLPMGNEKLPWHSQATQGLFKCYKQTAGMEIGDTRTMLQTRTIAGSNVIPFVLNGWEALDINNREDWDKAEYAVRNKEVEIPKSL